MKQICGSLKLELAQYREVAAFAAFGSDLDATTVNVLNRGVRLMEVLKQPQYKPLTVSQQVLILFAATKGYLDKIEVSDINKYQTELLSLAERQHKGLLDEIAAVGSLSDRTLGSLRSLCDGFRLA
jgi:F-type H+-transporting ATPase subunit alpha